MDRGKRIEENLLHYVGTVTHTGTELERNNEIFFKEWTDKCSYFKNHPEHWGLYPVKNDHLDRKIPWAFLKGKGNKTVVMIHHTDTVDTDDYGQYQEYAYKPYELAELYKTGKVSFNEETKEDLDSGEWLFGRGASDMKSGGAMHLSLFEEYAQEDFQGNILLMGLPDEENSSAGMRSAAYLMKELKEKYDLDYVLMLNGEPHERVDENKITIYDGSIGKIMPIFLARGKLSHVGQIYLGVNPVNMLAEVVRRTELNTEFMEEAGNTVAPPGTWLYFKDRKEVYDVSLPLTAGGYMSILPLKRSPMDIMNRLKEITTDAFQNVIDDMKDSYERFRKISPVDYGEMNYEPKVLFYDDIYKAVVEESGEEFLENLKKKEEEIIELLNQDEISRVEGAYRLIEFTLSYYKNRDPLIVLALAPPYYPSTSNYDLPNAQEMEDFVKDLFKYAKEEVGQELEIQNYFTGICDLSYGMFTDSDETIEYIKNNMLLWGENYEIPLELIKEMSMPVLNIGAWGKDLHKYTERIYKEDLLEKVPKLIDYTVRSFLKE
ncbi:MAG: M20/M25/M40 family metallo-hydrolase [Tissierellia bacterium]|nr:M20/M25/M40 family metallo-hydrolase [Tissierellia bacterium]